uniref:Interleukin 21 n=1 Tax=Sinocyclocheilus grahami TaxID=75366 RepID=A0A672S1I1_SINGR
MKASVCFVFAVVCWFAAQAEESPKILTLSKVMNELNKINKGMNIFLFAGFMLNCWFSFFTQDCCVKSALDCFRAKVFHLSVTDAKLIRSRKIISHELCKSVIVSVVSNCKPEEIQKAQCKSCDSYKKVDSQTFVQNFQTLLQKVS